MLFLVWEKLRSQNFDFPSLKNIRLQVSFGKLQLVQIPLKFKTSCCNLKIRDLEKTRWSFFLIMFHFGKTEARFFWEKAWLNLTQDRFLNTFTRFYRWQLQGYIYTMLKMYCLVNLELAKVQSVQIFDRSLGEGMLISEYFKSKLQLCCYYPIQC